MEFAEILALIKKAIFLVGGACVLILLYYRYIKPNKDITQEPPEENKKDKTSVVRVRSCGEDDGKRIVGPSDAVDIDENERRWIESEKSSYDDIFNEQTPQEKKQMFIEELRNLGYTEPKNTDMDADPFED